MLDFAAVDVPFLLLQNATPETGISLHVAVHCDPEPEVSLHVVDDDKFTHLVTAVAGGIVAIQIIPVIIKCFFIFLSPSFFCFEVKENHQIFSGGWSLRTITIIAWFIQYIHHTPTAWVGFILRRCATIVMGS